MSKAPLSTVASLSPSMLDKTIFLFIPTLDKERRAYVAAFMFRGKGAWREQKAPLSMPDFLAWVRATMPRPYPIKYNEEHMQQVDVLDFDNGLSLQRTAAGVSFVLTPEV